MDNANRENVMTRYTLEFADGTKTWVVAKSYRAARSNWKAYIDGFSGSDLHPALQSMRISSDQRDVEDRYEPIESAGLCNREY